MSNPWSFDDFPLTVLPSTNGPKHAPQHLESCVEGALGAVVDREAGAELESRVPRQRMLV